MKEMLQSPKYPDGQHPDADQLSAFVEQGLPEHERLETLAHLAECANCREIVALSLPPFEDAAAVEPVPVVPKRSSGWFAGLFSGWKLIWIAAPALAGLVVLTVHLRNLPVSKNEAVVPGQVADSHPPAQPAPLPLAAKPEPSNASQTLKATPASPPARTKHRAADGANSVAAPEINGRDIAELKQSPPPLIAKSGVATAGNSQTAAHKAGGPVPMRGSVTGIVRGAGAAPSAPRPEGPAMGSLQQAPRPSAAPMASAPLANQYASARPQPRQVQGQASVPAPGAALTTDSAANIVNAQNAPMDIAVTGRETLKMPGNLASPKGAYVPGQAPLPSGLAILSRAAHLHQQLVLDTRNQLFFSEDDGKHWKARSVPWQARAISVVAYAVAPTRPEALALAVPERYTPGATAIAQPGDKGGSLSGSVTDASGAIISGATVVATDSHTALVRTVQTDATGRYLVQELPPGVYRLEVTAAAFPKWSQTVVLAPPQQAVTNIVLAVGQSTQTVMVQASPGAKLSTLSGAMPPPVFVITTDRGDRWTSTDGRTWKPE